MPEQINIILIDPYRHGIVEVPILSTTNKSIIGDIRGKFQFFSVEFLMELENGDIIAASHAKNMHRFTPPLYFDRKIITGRAIVVGIQTKPDYRFINPLSTVGDLASKVFFTQPKRSKLRSIFTGQKNSFTMEGTRYLLSDS